MCSPSGSSSRGTAPRADRGCRAGQSAHGLPRGLANRTLCLGVGSLLCPAKLERWKMAEIKRLAQGLAPNRCSIKCTHF